MPDHSVHEVSDLASDERLLLERWLGRTLSGDETISLKAYRPHAAPAGANLDTLRRDIIAQAREMALRAGNISEAELDTLLDEAFSETRGKRG
jgi:hypothetical protein